MVRVGAATRARPLSIAHLLRTPHERSRDLPSGRRCGRDAHRSRPARGRERTADGRESSQHAQEPCPRRALRHREIRRQGHRSRPHRLFQPRHDDHHERAARDARRARWPPHHEGLPRRTGGSEPGARHDAVRLFLREAHADRAAEPDQGDRRAVRLHGQRARAPRPRLGTTRGARLESGARPFHRRLLPLLLCEPLA